MSDQTFVTMMTERAVEAALSFGERETAGAVPMFNDAALADSDLFIWSVTVTYADQTSDRIEVWYNEETDEMLVTEAESEGDW